MLGPRLIRGVSVALIAGGALALADALVALVWQEPASALVALIERHQIDRRWLSYRTAPLSAGERRQLRSLADGRKRVAYLAARERQALRPGDAVGSMSVPRLGARFLVVQGTDEQSLIKGPGHYPATGLPGQGRTVAVAGHRTTFLAPFRHLDALRPGDQIVLWMPYGRFVYGVQFRRVVAPSAWWVTRDVGYERLVLSTCTPLYSAADRIVVFARLKRFQPSAA